MTHSRSKKATVAEKSNLANKADFERKRSAKKPVRLMQNKQDDEAPSSDNRLQMIADVPLQSRKQTTTSESSAAEIVDFTNIVGENLSTLPSQVNLIHEQSTGNVGVSNRDISDSHNLKLTNGSSKKRKQSQSGDMVVKEADDESNDDEELATPSSKRCCKSDLKKCLRAGDIIENNRVPEHILKTYNDGKRLLAVFDGQNFVDLQTEKSYRSVTNWVKDRMLSLNKISTTSNISGWDYAIVHRDGYTTTLRLLVEETKQKADQMRAAMKEQREGTFTSPMVSTMFSESISPLLGSSSLSNSAILKSSIPIKNAQPTFGVSSFADTMKQQTTEAALHQRLVELRDQVSEVERMLYVSKTFQK